MGLALAERDRRIRLNPCLEEAVFVNDLNRVSSGIRALDADREAKPLSRTDDGRDGLWHLGWRP